MQRWIEPFKWFAYLVVLLMAVSVAYAAVTALRYWPVISV